MPGEETHFTVGIIPIQGDLILSPMDGYSDAPFRSLCRCFGSAMSYTEFVRDKDVLTRPSYIEKKLAYSEDERPVVFQLYGSDPSRLLAAAQKLQEKTLDAIDINMGCPISAIAQRGAGVGLMRRPLVVARIFKTLSIHLSIPVTAKIRLGWEDCRNYLLIARIIEENGGALVAVHGRTKEDRHSGTADLDAIAEVKAALSIPVLGNGGVETVADIERMKNHTGCDGVMIGRAARGNPWIFSWRDRDQIPPQEVIETMFAHLDSSLSFYGDEEGLVLFRKFATHYLAPYHLSRAERKALLTLNDPEAFKKMTAQVISEKSS
jgi:nifR3 family TIM-barrel protein